MRCLASSLAPLSSDGHGQHWPLDEAFILKKGQAREQVCTPVVVGRDIRHQPRWRVVQWRTWRWNPQHTPWNPCVCRRWRKRDVGESESSPRGCVWGRRNELELERCQPRPQDMSDPHPGPVYRRTRTTHLPGRLGNIQRLKIVEVSYP